MKQVVIINGVGTSGKDFSCDLVGEKYKVTTVSSARIPKEIAEKYFGWNGGKTEKDRKMLCDLKDIATEYNDIPFKDMVNEVEKFMHDDKDFLFIHIREPKEISKMIVTYPNAVTLLIRRKSVDSITSNHADANVEEYKYDFTINNDGTVDKFRERAYWFADKLFSGDLA